jgi:hypothetical protein
MSIAKVLPRKMVVKLAEMQVELEQFIEEQRHEREEKSNHWLESEVGRSHDAWLGYLEALAETLQDLPEKPE